jgi:hypothetical protein
MFQNEQKNLRALYKDDGEKCEGRSEGCRKVNDGAQNQDISGGTEASRTRSLASQT